MNKIAQILKEKMYAIKDDFFIHFWLIIVSVLLFAFSLLIIVYILYIIKEIVLIF